MDDALLNKAWEMIGDVRILINVAPKRAAQLARGAKALVPLIPGQDMDYLDIALKEIVEGKIEVMKPELEMEEEDEDDDI